MGDKLPICFSQYKKFDLPCDGNPDSSESDERTPCALKKICRSFGKYLSECELDMDSFLTESDGSLESNGKPGVFLEFCEKLANVKKKRNKTDARRKGPSYATKVASKRALQAQAKLNKKKLMEKFDFFTKRLSSKLPDFEFALSGAIPTPGKLYIMDRSVTSGYVSVYVRTSHGRDTLLVYLKLRPATDTFDALMICEYDAMVRVLSKNMISQLNPCERNNKQFKVLIKRLDRRKLALLAESIGALVYADIFDPLR